MNYAYNIQSFFTGFTSAWQKMTESVPHTLLAVSSKPNAAPIRTPSTSKPVKSSTKTTAPTKVPI